MFRTSMYDVRNVASLSWPYSGHGCHYLVMFRTSLALFRTSLALFQTSLATFRTSIIIFWSYSGHGCVMSGIRPGFPGHVPDIKVRCPEYGQFQLSMFRTSHIDVRNRASFNWPYSGHHHLMSVIWPVETGSVPDINV